jgi:hypothetical protein
METSPRSPSDQRSSSASPFCSSKSLCAFSPNTSRYYLLLCPGLKRSFFCIHLHLASQPIFSFEDPTRKSGQVIWTVFPQGFRDSPHLFWLALTQDLAEWQYPQATLLQYVDDFLLWGPNEPIISRATESLLNFLANRGYKISKEKAQLYQSRITYLDLVLEKEMRCLGEDRICPILMFCLPKTLKQLRAFLGVTGYCKFGSWDMQTWPGPYIKSLRKHRRIPSPLLNGMTSQKMHSTS